MRSNTPLPEETSYNKLSGIISTIQSISIDFSWFLSSTQIIEILEIKKESYYRELYSLRNSDFNPAKLSGFSESDCGYLIQLLEKILKIPEIEDEFIKSGVYFNDKSFSLLRENFIDNISEALSCHKLDKDLLMILSSATIQFDDAFDTYFYDKFSMERIISFTVEQFIEKYEIDPYYGSDIHLRKFLEDQVNYKKIPFIKLTEEYRERYFYELFGKFRDDKNKTKVSGEIKRLFIYFNLEEDADRKKLNSRYKELLKIYHPDINKNGLEKTKEIIQNYKKLSEFLGKS